MEIRRDGRGTSARAVPKAQGTLEILTAIHYLSVIIS